MQKGQERRLFSYSSCYCEISVHGQNCSLREMTLSVPMHLHELLLMLKSADLSPIYVSSGWGL